MHSDLKPMAVKLVKYCKNHLGFERPPKLFLKQDLENSQNALGRTAHYNPGEESITLFTTSRHPKDILRSLAHELVHHHQNLRGDLSPEKIGKMTPTYAQDNEHMRNMEKEAYLVGNILFRDWEDSYKNIHLKESINMYKLTKEEKRVLKKFALIREQKEEKNITEDDGAFAPNHYCVHHGGVSHNGKIEMAEAVNHNYNKELGRVTHYDMKLADGTILENVAFEDIQVTEASLATEHEHAVKDDEELDEMHCGTKDDDDKEALEEKEEKDEDDDKETLEEEEVSDEVKARTKPKDKANKADFLPKNVRDKINQKDESKIQTPEQESVLYENRFGNRNDDLFSKLTKKWAK